MTVMNRRNFFEEADSMNKKILEKLKIAKRELDALFETHQKVSDINQGLVYKKGVYLLLSDYKHAILYEGYEVQLVDVFIQFFQQMTWNEDNSFKEFAIRSIGEMGFKDIQILFSFNLRPAEKDRFKLIAVLADYAFIGLNRYDRTVEYKKLLQDRANLLTSKQKPIFDSMTKCLDDGNVEQHSKLVKKIRKLLEQERNNLYGRTTTPDFLRKSNIETVFSAFSHLIHGNLIILQELFSGSRRVNRNRLRITWILLMSGMNSLYHIDVYLKRKNIDLDIDVLYDEFKEVSQRLAQEWDIIEKK